MSEDRADSGMSEAAAQPFFEPQMSEQCLAEQIIDLTRMIERPANSLFVCSIDSNLPNA